jgi:hypothetical protein
MLQLEPGLKKSPKQMAKVPEPLSVVPPKSLLSAAFIL